MTPFANATARLKRRLGARTVCTDAAVRTAKSSDGSRIAFMPEAVIFPRNEADLAVVLKAANASRVPVTVRGGGSALTGAASPRHGGWVVDLSAWRKIKIDAEAGMARVQAGAIVADIHRAAAAAGRLYPPDPASSEYCTIGGNIACNAGGMHGASYGVTRDFVLALEGFLPTGEFVKWGAPLKKFSAGFNLRDLWIGSEGMLGIVTAATLKLVPAPAARWTLLAAFETEIDAFRAVRALFRAGVQPAICEFLDRATVACVERATGSAIFPREPGRALVLIELAGATGEVRDGKKTVTAWAETHARAQRTAKTRKEAESLWSARRQCSAAMFDLGDAKLNEDIVVPLRSYGRFARFIDRLRRESGLPIAVFGHLGDGNLHVNILYRGAKPKEVRAAAKAVRSLMENVVKLGGAISGEHGIGLAKSPFLRLQHSPAEVAAMRAVKRALDPNGILNPGKIFDVYEVWKHRPTAAKFPWDRQ